MPLDPQVESFLQRVATLNAPPVYTLTPEQARQTVPRIPQPYESIAQVEDRTIGGPHGEIPIRIYTPLAALRQAGQGPAPVMAFFHGGGWMIGDVPSYEHLCRIFANRFGSIVVSVEYRLSPEHRFPQGLDDCYTATAWVAEHAQTIGADARQVLVCGDSAGANLAAAVGLMARDRQGPPIACQILIYPATDYAFDTPSYRDNATGYLLTTAAMQWFWDNYLGSPEDAANPYASNLRGELQGLPPAVIITAEYDPLRDDGMAYADRLRAAGVPVVYRQYDGMIHGFVRRTDLYDAAYTAISDMASATETFLKAVRNND